MRLINADVFEIELQHEWENNNISNGEWMDIRQWLKDAPTIDAEPIIRCKDCRWGREVCGNIECSADLNLPPEYHGYEWFCPNGERREERGEKNESY